MRGPSFLTATAAVELAAGLGLLASPGLAFALLLGVGEVDRVGAFAGRLAGTALTAIGLASLIGRRAGPGTAHLGLMTGLLFYNAAVAALLVYAGVVLDLAGVALWPVVGLHTALAAWCGASVRRGS